MSEQRKDEVLIDVEDVALGHRTRMRWNDPDAWIWSDRPVHEVLIGDGEFRTVQDLPAAAGRRAVDRKPRRTPREFAPTGLMFCGRCSFSHDRSRSGRSLRPETTGPTA